MRMVARQKSTKMGTPLDTSVPSVRVMRVTTPSILGKKVSVK